LAAITEEEMMRDAGETTNAERRLWWIEMSLAPSLEKTLN
jgi:hypothetical protein